ncbi:hypothetical protein DL96DRAFT_1564162 [Flagelloscypha sp. PMI_526]|nr:hypothetical protein DL96DRAFT_1564162 [Flagelloscypha sp. PMI_526]
MSTALLLFSPFLSSSMPSPVVLRPSNPSQEASTSKSERGLLVIADIDQKKAVWVVGDSGGVRLYRHGTSECASPTRGLQPLALNSRRHYFYGPKLSRAATVP